MFLWKRMSGCHSVGCDDPHGHSSGPSVIHTHSSVHTSPQKCELCCYVRPYARVGIVSHHIREHMQSFKMANIVLPGGGGVGINWRGSISKFDIRIRHVMESIDTVAFQTPLYLSSCVWRNQLTRLHFKRRCICLSQWREDASHTLHKTNHNSCPHRFPFCISNILHLVFSCICCTIVFLDSFR